MSPSMASKTGQQAASSTDRASQKKKQAALLTAAQSLLIETNRLEPKYRALYLKELTEVSVVMAYPQPEFSPAKTYLGIERRQALAEQVDAAILCRYNSLYVIPSSLLPDPRSTHSRPIQFVRFNHRIRLYPNSYDTLRRSGHSW